MVDLFATFAAAVGEKLPDDAGEDSFDMLAALEGSESGTAPRPALVHHSGGGAFGLRDGRWKIVFGRGEQVVQPMEGAGYLFDLETDLRETTDLWDEHPLVVERLTTTMRAFCRQGRSVPRR